MKAQELNRIACAVNYDSIKNEYAVIMSSCEAAARRGEFSIESTIEKITDKIHNQLLHDGFKIHLGRCEDPESASDQIKVVIYFPAQKSE